MIVHSGSYAMAWVGDCRDSLAQMAAAGVRAQTCVTSPPYYGLRDYGHDGQIGLEPSPDEYVAAMVEVFRGVRGVLADDGTLWLNIGDSYSNAGTRQGDRGGVAASINEHRKVGGGYRTRVEGCKNKDLIGIPWMLAFALRADGWYLRQDIIWHKPNPMPESVTDRCTKAHEYIFLLSKSERYYFDSAAMREPQQSNARAFNGPFAAKSGANGDRNDWGRGAVEGDGKRNKRSVWTVTPKPYRGAHFAVYPPDLIEPCILAGSRPGDTVLDPFGGSGTTAGVALKHGRNAALCELNPEYAALMPARVEDICSR